MSKSSNQAIDLEKIQAELENHKIKMEELEKTVEVLKKLFSNSRDLLVEIQKDIHEQSAATQSQFNLIRSENSSIENKMEKICQLSSIEASSVKSCPVSTDDIQSALKQLENSMMTSQKMYLKMEKEMEEMKQQMKRYQNKI